MVKASPSKNSFNQGVFSALVEGRTDMAKYPASMRVMRDFISVPQGPAIRRSGTLKVASAYSDDKNSALIPFVFSDEQALQLEFTDLKMRILSEAGVQIRAPVAITNIVTVTPLKFTSAALAAQVPATAIGKQIFLNGFAVDKNINGVVGKITAIAGNDFTLDINYSGAAGAIVGATAAEVYEITTPYSHNDVSKIVEIQSADVLYLFCPGYRPYKLGRYDTYDWRLTAIDFIGGPFMPEEPAMGTLTITGTGNVVPIMTSASLPSGAVITSGDASAAKAGWKAFDNDPDTYWESNTSQKGIIEYDLASALPVTGYTIYHGADNADTSYAAVDYAPGTFTFEAWNGATWIVLDSQVNYVLYDGGRSVHFQINNTVAYGKYRLNIIACRRNGTIAPRIARLVLTTSDVATNTLSVVLSGTYTALNKGAGFLATDIGRLIRVRASDTFYRIAKILTRTDATHITVQLLSEPLLDASKPILNWQAGYFSDTLGWPTCASFFEDRLAVAGVPGVPDLVALSRTGAYEDFTQRTSANEVQDDHAIVVRLNARRLSSIRWMATDERGLLIGTGSAEWILGPSNADQALTGRNIKARQSTKRGSARITPVEVDRQVLYVQASGRTIRELAYVFEADGYRSPSMSLFASHMGVPSFAELAFAAEPHNLVWCRRIDGSMVAMTYNREEEVIGWHNHDFGGIVESISVIPSIAEAQDTLWIVIRRTVNGVSKRYIERLTKFWDFNSTLATAHFVDCAVWYDGAETDTLYGLMHQEGNHVDGLADGKVFRNLLVTGGKVVLPFKASKVIVGRGYKSYAETSRIEAGATDGTAQGKEKRIHNCVVLLWQSALGEIGRHNEDRQEDDFTAIEYREPYDELNELKLNNEMVGPMIMPQGYGKRGSLLFQQEDPLPFNVIALLPQLDTQDRG